MGIIGIIVGIVLAVGIACFITSIVLLKSNDMGNSTGSLEQYAGYDPIIAENAGQVSGMMMESDDSNPFGFGRGF
ncbi:MAG: hypothetical protein K5879_00780 [Lachnospiraceae bacterium]|nr:hypothetical protein [Lachnospiraceae bacterium]